MPSPTLHPRIELERELERIYYQTFNEFPNLYICIGRKPSKLKLLYLMVRAINRLKPITEKEYESLYGRCSSTQIKKSLRLPYIENGEEKIKVFNKIKWSEIYNFVLKNVCENETRLNEGFAEKIPSNELSRELEINQNAQTMATFSLKLKNSSNAKLCKEFCYYVYGLMNMNFDSFIVYEEVVIDY